MRKLKSKTGVLLTFEGLCAFEGAEELLALLRQRDVPALFLFTKEELLSGGETVKSIRRNGWRIALLGAGHGLWSGPVRQWERARIARAYGEKYDWSLCGYRPKERFLSPFAHRCVLRAGWADELLWNRELLPSGRTERPARRRLVYGGDIVRIDCGKWQKDRLLWALEELLGQMERYGLAAADAEPAAEKKIRRTGRKKRAGVKE